MDARKRVVLSFVHLSVRTFDTAFYYTVYLFQPTILPAEESVTKGDASPTLFGGGFDTRGFSHVDGCLKVFQFPEQNARAETIREKENGGRGGRLVGFSAFSPK